MNPQINPAFTASGGYYTNQSEQERGNTYAQELRNYGYDNATIEQTVKQHYPSWCPPSSSSQPPQADDQKKLGDAYVQQLKNAGWNDATIEQTVKQYYPGWFPTPKQVAGRQMARFLSAFGLSSNKSTMVVGCGREGHFLVAQGENRKHQHAQKGERTMDIDSRNNPDVVADIATPNLVVTRSDIANLGKFEKVVLENVPSELFATQESSQTIVDNIMSMTEDKSKVTVKTGVRNPQYTQNMIDALTSRGFTIKTHRSSKIKAEK